MKRARSSEALVQLLRELPARIPPEEIDQLWLFPPREMGGRESGLVVLALFSTGAPSPDHRKVLTLGYEAERVGASLRRTDSLQERGYAPAELVPGLISGVLRRLGDETEDPITSRVGGDPVRWHELVHELESGSVDRASQE